MTMNIMVHNRQLSVKVRPDGTIKVGLPPHVHNNKPVLDRFSDVAGQLLYQGQPIQGGSSNHSTVVFLYGLDNGVDQPGAVLQAQIDALIASGVPADSIIWYSTGTEVGAGALLAHVTGLYAYSIGSLSLAGVRQGQFNTLSAAFPFSLGSVSLSASGGASSGLFAALAGNYPYSVGTLALTGVRVGSLAAVTASYNYALGTTGLTGIQQGLFTALAGSYPYTKGTTGLSVAGGGLGQFTVMTTVYSYATGTFGLLGNNVGSFAALAASYSYAKGTTTLTGNQVGSFSSVTGSYAYAKGTTGLVGNQVGTFTALTASYAYTKGTTGLTVAGGDTTAPVVTAFTITNKSPGSMTATINAFTATDAVGVTGYLITESTTPPSAGAAGWSATPIASFTASGTGITALYAWAKDAAGNVSSYASQTELIFVAPPYTQNFDGATVGATSYDDWSIIADSDNQTAAISNTYSTTNQGTTGRSVKLTQNGSSAEGMWASFYRNMAIKSSGTISLKVRASIIDYGVTVAIDGNIIGATAATTTAVFETFTFTAPSGLTGTQQINIYIDDSAEVDFAVYVDEISIEAP